MSDTLCTYRSVKKDLIQLFPRKPKGHLAQAVDTLAWTITGIILSHSCQLPDIANYMPGAQRESEVKRLERYTRNERNDDRCSYPQFARRLLKALAKRLPRLVLIIDGSVVGKGCRALVISVLFGGRALPLAFLVETGSKGHFGEDDHLALLDAVRAIVPAGIAVTFLGDGEFDGVDLLARLESFGWEYVCRTASNALLTFEKEEPFPFEAITPAKGEVMSAWARFTAARYGPVFAVAAWRPDCSEPIFLVSNLHDEEAVLQTYQKRGRIETFFGDEKSRGFGLHESHIADPKRLARLMTAACLAYLWVIYLGVVAKRDGWQRVIHRRHRCDLSLFQLGLVLLLHLLNRELSLPSGFLPSGPNLLAVIGG